MEEYILLKKFLKVLKKHIFLIIFIILFIVGILFILRSNIGNLGTFESMHLAGTILCVFGAVGILLEIHKKKSP